MGTIHANSPYEALARLENLILMAASDLPHRAIRQQMADSLEYLVLLKRNEEGARVVGSILEVTGFEGERILTQELGGWKKGVFTFSGVAPKRTPKFIELGMRSDFFQRLK
jgi:pilus assembly protein CpaF